MALTDIRIIAGGVTNYLVNSTGSPVPGGAATAVSTTPFAVLNDDWTIQTAQPNAAYQGGPPLTQGSLLAYQAYDNTQQSIPCSVEGSSHDNVVSLLRGLRRLLNTTLMARSAVLYYQPNGATNPLYFEIQSGAIQEKANPLNPTGGFSYIEFDLLLTLKPFGGLITSGETLMNAITFTVAGSTVTLPSNTNFYSGGSGDMIAEGSSLNIRIAPTTAGSNIGELWAGSVYTAIQTTVNTSLSAYPTSSAPQAANLTSLQSHNTNHLRVIARVNNTTGGAVSTYRIGIRGSLAGGSVLLFLTPAPGISPTKESVGLVDFGPIPLDALHAISPLTNLFTIDFYATTTAGACSLISTEILDYQTFCKITKVNVTQAGGETLFLNGFREKSTQVCLPSFQSANNLSSANNLYQPAIMRGQLPPYIASAGLWLNWLDSAGDNPIAATRAASVTVTHAPLYFSLRGAG